MKKRSASIYRMILRHYAIALLLPALSACSMFSGSNSMSLYQGNKDINMTLISQGYPASGTLVISRLMEDVSVRSGTESSSYSPLVGYTPSSLGRGDTGAGEIVINPEKKLILGYKGGKALVEAKVDLAMMPVGQSFELVSSQRDPLWFAPDSYFIERGLKVPSGKSDNSLIRYRRGALGDRSITLRNAAGKDGSHLILHCAKLWSPEVGGIRMETRDLEAILAMLEEGASVIVR